MIEPTIAPSVADVGAHYDDLDRFYREIWGEHVHHGLWTTGKENAEQAVAELVRLIADKAGIQPGHQVCDVGCGYGATARQLTAEYGARVTGLTVSQAQFDYATAQTSGHAGPQFLLQDWTRNEFPASAFDALVSIECVSHVADKLAFFAEFNRVLRPGGKAAICAWLACERPRPWQVSHLLEPICREGRLPSMGAVADFRDWIRQAGLRLLEVQILSRQVRKTWEICARRAVAGILTKAEYRRFLLRRPTENWIFFVTLWRIMLAYRSGAMQYGLFVVARHPE